MRWSTSDARRPSPARPGHCRLPPRCSNCCACDADPFQHGPRLMERFAPAWCWGIFSTPSRHVTSTRPQCPGAGTKGRPGIDRTSASNLHCVLRSDLFVGSRNFGPSQNFPLKWLHGVAEAGHDDGSDETKQQPDQIECAFRVRVRHGWLRRVESAIDVRGAETHPDGALSSRAIPVGDHDALRESKISNAHEPFPQRACAHATSHLSREGI